MTHENELAWFHGKISRETAEHLLLRDGDSSQGLDGRFLVRDSTTAIGDYVLSLVHGGQVIHYQIRKHGDDAFFSIDDGPIIHGLETLIEHYRVDASGLSTTLGPPLRGTQPPADCRLHGRTNLLHRATKEGNYTVVDELLKSGYHSLDAKNQDGQTGLHLASILGHNNIIRRLIEAGASVNTRDRHGLTPLHYACQTNRPVTARILIDMGRANLQSRSCHDGWVAMHEAASRGHAECVKVLLAANAPCHPRTDINETPKDLAVKLRHWECSQILENYKPPQPKISYRDWFHNNIDRDQALELLQTSGFNDGSFLLRSSSRKKGMFVLSMVHADHPFHFEIQRQDRYFYIDNGPYLESLEHVVSYYSQLADGLPTKLQKNVKPAVPSILPEMSPTANLVSSPPCNWTPNTSPVVDFNRNFSDPVLAERKKSNDLISWNLDREAIFIETAIGEGEFGSVFRGTVTSRADGSKTAVAVKQLRDDSVLEGKESFTKEATVMMNLNHPCIVQLLGLCLGPPMMLVQELMSGGGLLDFLIDHPDEVSFERHICVWAGDVVEGMLYLEQKHFVHRDLAARNILLTSVQRAKITDFGLSRAIGVGKEYYKASHGGKWPVKWYAPESVNYGTFSSASDVWSFGVSLWEMLTKGEAPYGELTGAQVIKLIEQGERLPKPSGCPDSMYQLMLRCWAHRPEDRTTFVELKSMFSYESGEPPHLTSSSAATDTSPPTPPIRRGIASSHVTTSDYYSTSFNDCLEDVVEV